MKHSLNTKKLPNGIEVLFIDIPGVTSFDFVAAFNSGYRFANNENPDKYEVPHVLEHLVFDGSKHYPDSDALIDVFQSDGGACNGVTNPYVNFFPFHNRVSNAESIITAALDMVFFPKLTEQSFNEEKIVIENELMQGLGDIESGAEMYTMAQIIPDMVMSADVQLARLPNVEYSDIKKYHDTYFVTKNASIIVAADFKKISKKKIEESILKATAAARLGKQHSFPAYEVKPASLTPQYVAINKMMRDSVTSMQFTIPSKATVHERISMQLLSWMASGMKSYAVNYKLRKKGLIYGLNFAFSESLESHGLEIDINADNDKFVDVLAYTLQGIRDFIAKGVTKEQFDQAKKEFKSSLEDGQFSSDDIMGWYMADYFQERETYTAKDYEKFVDSITQKDVFDLGQKLFNYENMYASVFSAKGVRAATSIDMLSKKILKQNADVTPQLINDNSVSISSKDTAFKLATGIPALIIGALLLTPYVFSFHSDTIPSIVITSLHIAIVYGLYYGWLLLTIISDSGYTLRRNTAGLSAFFLALTVVLLSFDAGKVSAIISSNSAIVLAHTYAILALMALLAIFTGFIYLRNLVLKRKNS